jgi:tetratricopeptide (TPR) repeat protein
LPAAETDLDPWTVDHFRQAIEAQKAKQFDQAAQQYRLVLSKNPRFAEAYMNLGIVYQLQGKYPDSVKVFREGLAIKPEMLAAQVLMGISYYMDQDFEPARKSLEQALAHNPKERQAGMYRALTLIGLDQPEEAARQLRQTAQYYPGDTEISYYLGTAYSEGVKKSAELLVETGRETALFAWAMALSAEQKNDTGSALVNYLKTLEIDPNIPQVYVHVAALFEKAGYPDLARDALARLAPQDSQPSPSTSGSPQDKKDYLELWQKLGPIRSDPHLPRIADSYVNRVVKEHLEAEGKGVLRDAVRLYEQGDFKGAEARLGSGAKAGADAWIPAYLLARCYLAEGDFDTAEQVVETSLAGEFKLPSVALLKLETQSELALRSYETVLAKQPDSNAARILRAKSLAAANSPEKAIEEYREVLRAQPEAPEAHLGIAQIYADQLNWAGVIEELKQELAWTPNNGLALALLGHALAESDEADKAIPILQKVLLRYPHDAEALADLGKALAQNNQNGKAIEAFESAVRWDPSRYRLHYRLYQLYQSTGQPDLANRHLAVFQAEDSRRRAKAVMIRSVSR